MLPKPASEQFETAPNSWNSSWWVQFVAMFRLRRRLFAADTSAMLPFFGSPLFYCMALLTLSGNSSMGPADDGAMRPGLQPEPVSFGSLVPSIPWFVGGGNGGGDYIEPLLDSVNSTITAHRFARYGNLLKSFPANYWHQANSLAELESLSQSTMSFYGAARDYAKPQSIPSMGGFMLHSSPVASQQLNISIVINPNPELSWARDTPIAMLNAFHDSIQHVFPPGQPDQARLVLPPAIGNSSNPEPTAMFVIERLLSLFANSTSSSSPAFAPWAVQLNGTQSAFRVHPSEVDNGGTGAVLFAPPLLVMAIYFFLLPSTRNMVADRVDGQLNYFAINGLAPSAFFLSSVAAHVCLSVAAVVSMLMFIMFIPWLSLSVTVALMVCFSIVVVLQASTLSFVFASKDAVPSVMYLVIVFASAGPQLISGLLDSVTPPTLTTLLNLLLPSFATNRCLTEMVKFNNAAAAAAAIAGSTSKDKAAASYQPFAHDSSFLATLGILLAHAVLCAAVTMYLAHRASRVAASSSSPSQSWPASIAALVSSVIRGGHRGDQAADLAADDVPQASYQRAADVDPAAAAEKTRMQSGQLDDADTNSDVVRIQGLGMTFPSSTRTPHHVLTDLWFSVKRNECFAFLGPNGSGKSTTIAILTGALEPTRGSATVCGKSPVDPGVKRLLGVCPQADHAYGHLTVMDHLRVFAAIKGIAKEHVDEAVDQVVSDAMLEDYLYRRVDQLSGGTRRRMSIAIACLGNPAVVILDEPTTGVDLATRRIVWESILRLKTRTSVLLVTHDMDEANCLSERAGIMINGSLVCLGTPRRLKSLFGTGHLLKLQFAHALGSGSVSVSAAGSNADAHDLIPTCMDRAVSDTEAFAAQDGKHVRVVHQGESSIELAIDAFGGGEAGGPGKSQQVASSAVWLGRMLEFVVERRQVWQVTDWALGEMSLDELFVRLARQHRAYQEEERGSAV